MRFPNPFRRAPEPEPEPPRRRRRRHLRAIAPAAALMVGLATYIGARRSRKP